MKYLPIAAALGGSLLVVISNCNRNEPKRPDTSLVLDPVQGQEPARMASAPQVPPPIARRHATRVILDVEVKEQTRTLADGVTYTYWTFGDEAPGQFIRVREGDLIETHLHNHP